MGEGDVVTGGGSKKKVIAIIIVSVLIITSIGTYLLLNDEDQSNDYPDQISLFWDTEYTEAAWLVKVVDIQMVPESQHSLSLDEIYYGINDLDTWEHLEEFQLSAINNAPSPFGLKWIDLNNNTFVEIGDYLRINKSGGSGGILNPDTHELILADGSGRLVFYPSGVVNLPPAEFLDMDVVKTTAGWNITVTWVNETVPGHFLEVGYVNNISFRLENLSGELFTTADPNYAGNPGYVFGLNFIDDNFTGDWNWNDMGFYNITWYDNDRNGGLSVNDTLVIYDYENNIESGFKLRLICSKYGWVHTIYEVTFG